MRVKEIERTANVAWSPASQYPIYMVAGTAAQQLDATFSTSSALEIYSLNLAEATLEMPLIASIQSECRFHKVLWGSYGMDSDESGFTSGVIVAGTDSGSILVYSAETIIEGDSDCSLMELTSHSGAVKALDFNPFQTNLLASGASESEIFIWDLHKPEKPMTPGQKSQPFEEVACVSWNRQVQHILASTFAARCVVWDLRKNEPIIKVSDSMSRIKAKMVAWHPEVATQMCLSSEDDHTPVIQLWDLRYATSPLKVLENHQRGVLSIAWCHRDPDLLLSCGKDNRILCWNPNSHVQGGEVVFELPTNNQWSFDVQWCPRNPGLISSSTFDGHVTIYSLTGGGHPIQPSNKGFEFKLGSSSEVTESFNTGDSFSQVPVQVPQLEEKVMTLRKPPKWIRKPVGATFAFGGKLVTFEPPAVTGPQQVPQPCVVYISQVVTETELVAQSHQLQQALASRQFVEFCTLKATNSSDVMQENIWNFIRVNFENEPRSQFLQLLGYDQTELAKKVANYTGTDFAQPLSPGVDAKELAQKMSQLSAGDTANGVFSASGQASPSVGSKTPNSRDELSDGCAAFDEIAGIQKKESGQQTPLVFSTDSGDANSLMVSALLMGNFEAAVEMCLTEDRMAEAILLAIAGGPELLLRTQKKYFQRNKSNLSRLISSVVTHDWMHIVTTCDLDNWKEALAIILTYALPEEFAELCDALASRLETEKHGELSLYASLCYICSGNLEKLVENWARNTDNNNAPLALQDLVEKVMVLRQAVEISRGQVMECGNALAERLSQYAGLLAAQGSLSAASTYLNNNSGDMRLAILQDRIYRALGSSSAGISPPPFPFQRINILPQGAKLQQTQTQASRGASQQQQRVVNNSFQPSAVTPVNTFSAQQQQSQQHFPLMNGPAPVASTTFTPQPSSTNVAQSKGPKSHKYPTQIYQQQSTAYGLDKFPQPSVQQPDYSQNPSYVQSNYYGPGYSSSTASAANFYNPVGSTPNYNTPAPVTSFNPSSTPSYNPPPSAQNYNQAVGGPYSSIPPVQGQLASYQDRKAEIAWNDPPPVAESKKSKPAAYEQPHAITSPIFGVQQPTPSEQGPPGGPMNFGNYGSYGGLYNPQEHQPVAQPTSISSYNPPPASTQTSTQQPPKQAAEPPKPVPKGPLPAEHKVMQDVFEKLLSACSQRATNAQMKRKLEDVARKLEILYDRLRDGTLSQSVLLGLHQLVQAVQGCDYPASLGVHTGLISHGNFSEISAFMPAVKVLLQTASQLNVFVQ